MFWVGEQNETVAAQTQVGLVLSLGEKIFRNGDLTSMQRCFQNMQQSMRHELRLDALEPKAQGCIMQNGWSCQAYVDFRAIVVFGVCLAHVSQVGQKFLATGDRIAIMEYIRNKDKTSTRVRMMLKGMAKPANASHLKAISDLLTEVERTQRQCRAIGSGDFELKAQRLKEIIMALLVSEASPGTPPGSPGPEDAPVGEPIWFEKLFMNLSQVTEEHESQVMELATMCQEMSGREMSGQQCADSSKLFEIRAFVGKSMMDATERLLGEVKLRRRIASFVIVPEVSFEYKRFFH